MSTIIRLTIFFWADGHARLKKKRLAVPRTPDCRRAMFHVPLSSVDLFALRERCRWSWSWLPAARTFAPYYFPQVLIESSVPVCIVGCRLVLGKKSVACVCVLRSECCRRRVLMESRPVLERLADSDAWAWLWLQARRFVSGYRCSGSTLRFAAFSHEPFLLNF